MASKIDSGQYISVQPPFAEEDKERAKERKNLLALATVLKELESGLVSTRGQIQEAGSPSGSSATASGSAFEDAMADMETALQLLEIVITKAGQSKGKSDELIAQAYVKRAADVAKEVQDKIAEIADEKAQQAVEAFWSKVGAWVGAVLISIAAVAAGQVEVAVLTIAMTTLVTTGAFEKAADGISSLLQQIPGVSKLAADIIAKVFVLVVVVAVSFAAAPASAASEVESTVEDAETEMQNLSQEIEGATGEATGAAEAAPATTGTLLDKLGKVWKAVNLFNRLGTRANTVIMNTVQTLSQIGIGTIVDDVPTDQMSKDDKERLKMILSIVIMIATLIVSIGGASAMSEAMGAGQGGISKLGKLCSALVKFAQKIDVKGMMVLEALRKVASGASSATQIAEGATTIRQGQSTLDLANSNAILDVLSVLMETQSSSASSSVKATADTLQEHTRADKHFIETFCAGEKAFAQLFTTASPV